MAQTVDAEFLRVLNPLERSISGVRHTRRDGGPAVECGGKANDEMAPAKRRSWGDVRGEELYGVIFFHGGDESEFAARKTKSRKKPKNDD